MKRLLSALLFLAVSCFAQNGQVIVGNYGVNYVLVVPSGSCNQNATMQEVLGPGTLYSCQSGTWTQIGGASGAGTVTSVGTTAPITGGTITTTGTIACATCATTTNGGVLSATAPATISAAGVIACATCATTTNGGALIGTAPITVSAAGVIAAPTAVTSASALTSGNVMSGAGSQASQTTSMTWTPNTLTLGVAGGGNAVLALPGNTSGSATFTAPTTAGTTTNAVVASNVQAGPDGTAGAPTYSFSAVPTTGMFRSNTIVSFAVGGVDAAAINGTGTYRAAAGGGTAWCASGAASTCTLDTGITRSAANVVAVGNSGAANETALLRWGGPCKITAAVALTVGGGSTAVCTWTLPTGAKTWGWMCSGTYNVSAGTTPTFGLGMNASQTPTSETGNATISTIAGGSTTQVTTANSATATSSGNQSIMATPAAALTTITNAPWTSFGTIQASATTGTFAITAIVTGTSAVGQVNPGSVCELY